MAAASSSASSGEGSTESPNFPVSRENLDPTKVLEEASGLNKSQLQYLSLLWVEVRRFITTLAGDGRVFHPADLTFIEQKKKDGSLNLDIANQTFLISASNLWYSRLWEQQFGVLRYGYPLRQVHNFYMLQMQKAPMEAIVIKPKAGGEGDSAEKDKSQDYGKKNLFFRHFTDLKVDKEIEIPVPTSRFPQKFTPSLFWGMLMIYWVENIEMMLQLLPVLRWNDYLLKAIDRMHAYIDSYYKASGFVSPQEAENMSIDLPFETFSSFEIKDPPQRLNPTGQADFATKTTLEEFLKPRDPFENWRTHLRAFGDNIRNFDWVLCSYLSKVYSSGQTDSIYLSKVYSKAQYLNRYWEHENGDKELEKSFSTLTETLSSENFTNATVDTSDDGVLQIRSLDNFYELEVKAVKSTATAARLHKQTLTNIKMGRFVTAQDIKQATEVVPIFFNMIMHNFYILHMTRTNLSLLIDVYDDKLVVKELNENTVEVERDHGLLESDVTFYWLRVASQYGVTSVVDTGGIVTGEGERVDLEKFIRDADAVAAENMKIRRMHARRMAKVKLATYKKLKEEISSRKK